MGNTDQDQANRQIDLCLDRGVNLIDTANVYNAGISEEMIGIALAESGRRQRMLVGTKVRFRMHDGPNGEGLSRRHIIEQAEASLKRLKTDVIDLYQVHEWDGSTPIEETVEALDALVRSGKVRYLGCSNYSGWHISKALAAADRHNRHRFVCQQIHYTLNARESELELIPISQDQGLGVLVWSPLAGGLLSGKYRRTGGPDTGRHVGGYREPVINDWDKLYNIVDVLVAIAEARNVPASQIVLAWLLARPGVTSAIIGGRSQEQLAQNLDSIDIRLTLDETERLDAVSLPALPYPYWHQALSVPDRLGDIDLALLAPYIRKSAQS
ncbi:putative short-chain dehydrogenase/oxidoreductase [Ensifer adhaerens OV14]|nr:putative short-chain dehydrogenase/oxidoreductase [Ensifer adhaerens OV14]